MKVWLAVLFCFGSVWGQALENHDILDANGAFHVSWTVAGNSATFEIAVQNLGYAGFGFSPNGEMTNSDVIITWVAGTTTHFTDRFAVARAEPVIDTIQNYNLLSASENTTHTVVRFSRLIDTGDAAQDRVIASGPISVIYSFHPDDPVEGQPLPWHGSENRGSKIVTIIP